MHAIFHNALHEGKYYCMSCKYPPCKICQTKLIAGTVSTKQMFKEYNCKNSSGKSFGECAQCYNCNGESVVSTGKSHGPHRYCSQTCLYPPCLQPGCDVPRPRTNPHKYCYDVDPNWLCAQHDPNLKCKICGTTCDSQRFAGHKKEGDIYCEKCKRPPCMHPGCSTPRPNERRYNIDRLPQWFCKYHR